MGINRGLITENCLSIALKNIKRRINMTLKQFTAYNGNKVIVNMEQVKCVIEDDEEGYISLRFNDSGIIVKGTLESLMRWYQKQNQAKKAKTIEIPQATFTPLTNDDLFRNKDNHTPIDITPKITW